MKKVVMFLIAMAITSMVGSAYASWTFSPSGTVDTSGLAIGSTLSLDLIVINPFTQTFQFDYADISFALDTSEVSFDVSANPVQWMDGLDSSSSSMNGGMYNIYAIGSSPITLNPGATTVATIFLTLEDNAGPWDGSDFVLWAWDGSGGLYTDGLVYTDEVSSWNGPDYGGTVPIPSAVFLFGSGLVGLVGTRRRFKKLVNGKS